MSKLDEIMVNYGTDKAACDHNYVPFYEKIFNGRENEKLKILEIGIFRQPIEVENRLIGKRVTGASLKTWYDYLPNTEIYGADLYDFTDVNNDRIKTMICNQESKEDLNTLINTIGSDFDVIIDDGGHTMKQHQISISILFKHLKKGGIYVIEDLCTCHMPSYVMGDKTTLILLDEFKNTGKFNSKYITDKESSYIENNIERVEVYMAKSSEISLIYKK